MREWIQRAMIYAGAFGYRSFALPALLSMDAQTAHETVLQVLARADCYADRMNTLREWWRVESLCDVGGVALESPFMLSAGLVKGHGFTTEQDALNAVYNGANIMPGWAALPALLGQVEFGSFTRAPRTGNPGKVIWRDAVTRSTQNRVGLKNPGAVAAAEFLSMRPLPRVFGVNIAVTPGVTDPAQEVRDVVESFEAFLSRGVIPAWFTLNISCPNTEDDPQGHQTETRTRDLCAEIIRLLNGIAPLWVKLSPDLSDAQYEVLARVFAETGVKAVITTNTLGLPAPDNSGVTAGVGGGRLHAHALRVAGILTDSIRAQGYPLDVIACGGVQDAPTYQAYHALGVRAAQYWSGLIYRGPWIADRILLETKTL